MRKSIIGLLILCVLPLKGQEPSTIITSDRMEMTRGGPLNEFKFFGQVKVHSKDFDGECDEMVVFSLPQAPIKKISDSQGEPMPEKELLDKTKELALSLGNKSNDAKKNDLSKEVGTRENAPSSSSNEKQDNKEGESANETNSSVVNKHAAPTIGQIKEIIALGHVYLKTEDKSEGGETKEANAGKALIYPQEGKMVLTEAPVVRCSKQGTFSGDKITFFKDSDRVIVENKDSQQRSQAILSTENTF